MLSACKSTGGSGINSYNCKGGGRGSSKAQLSSTCSCTAALIRLVDLWLHRGRMLPTDLQLHSLTMQPRGRMCETHV